MEHPILITWLNDFIFCPVSIYFHNLYGEKEDRVFQEPHQINGSAAHESVDSGKYTTKKSVLTGVPVFCEKYGLTGKIDIFDVEKGELIERKKKVKTIYDGYVFQIYGQYFSLMEAGYSVKKLTIRSLDDNRKYNIPLPAENEEMLRKFEKTVEELRSFRIEDYKQTNPDKCAHCIYEPLCDSSLL